MFRMSHFGDLDEDPFFSDPLRAHRDHMRQMVRSFSEPFGAPFLPSIMDGRNRGRLTSEQPGSSAALRSERQDMMRDPFGMFDMMENMRNRMDDMHRNFENMSVDPNTHSFSSSSVMTYSKVGNEPPKVFQATSSTRRAPGGIKETRRAVKDSESGLEKMSIGHHIQDRGHVVEKKVNKKTGNREFCQDFQNMDESEAQTFDEEWQQQLSRFQPSASMSRVDQPRRRGVQWGPEPAHRQEPKSKAVGKPVKKGSDPTRK